MSDATPSPAAGGTTAKLFVRQSSGLVRNVSVKNALFFNVAAFLGVGLTLYPIFYSLGFVPVWKFGPLSEYGWAAIIAGAFCAVLALIFGQALVFNSPSLLAYGALIFLAFHIFIVNYEEPTLRRTHGHNYDTYFANVPRWLPRLTPWTHT